ncbi:MAG: nucleoside triphosphate pyrophosphohydrolase [Geminicoccaceae bacterium]|nr:nucleoside triphosphate pyrophosphohydrolase [Geminicoccaceae bacterium]HRY25132.1 nucleoside triphosphate pyrophosphohydrolase [Geminicoccaceae bacterium]
MSAERPIDRLLAVMRRLRDPEIGCSWDIEQTFATIAPYTIEEAYEVADAIERADWEELRGELGDLLLQVVYHAQMAAEAGLFGFDDVATAIADKMIARHPHVFGDVEVKGAEAQHEHWESAKAAERQAKAASDGSAASLLDNLPHGLPALTRALKLQKRVLRVGFDWPDIQGVRDKVNEELDELESAAPDERELELGDLLFTLVNHARRLGLDPETALRRANAKFESRFRRMERTSDRPLGELDLEALEALWQRVKTG